MNKIERILVELVSSAEQLMRRLVAGLAILPTARVVVEARIHPVPDRRAIHRRY